MDEFELIRKYFSFDELNGDDGAFISIPAGFDLAISVDALEEGAHFFSDDNPHSVGHKLLAVNLSDMAACGASPRFATLSLGLPEIDEPWLDKFSKGLYELAARYGVRLIGGDTCKASNYHAGMQIIGFVPAKKGIKRSGAKPGDLIFITGKLGGAAHALAVKTGKIPPRADINSIRRLEYPEPPVDFGGKIRDLASAAIDISDGLLSDLNHILTAGKVGARLRVQEVPHERGFELLDEKDRYQFVLAGGEDYELCFTAELKNVPQIKQIAAGLKMDITHVGEITASGRLEVDGIIQEIENLTGFSHF